MNHVIDHEEHDARIKTLGGFVVNPPLAISNRQSRVIGGHSTDRELYKRPATAGIYQYIFHHGIVNNPLLNSAR